MDYFKGTYSFFRYPNEKFVGFSPFLGYLNVRIGFLRKAFDMKRGSYVSGSGIKGYPYMEQLVDKIFNSIEGNLTATISPRKPIYIISKAGLLNEFIIHVMANNIEGFKNNHEEDLIETHVSEYTELLKCECNKKETEDKCKKIKSCCWDTTAGCKLKDTTTEINNNKKKFIKNLRKFFELINKCIENTISPDENNIFTPYYLLGITLMSYWYLIKNIVFKGSEKEYFNDYMRTVKMYIGNSASNDPDIDEIDDYISKNNLIELPKSLSMIHADVDNHNYPACFETVINEFFNLLFYDDKEDNFITKIEGIDILQSLIEHYEYINKNNSDYTSHFIINKFVKLTTNIPGIEYNDNGYNIKSTYKNFLTILNYFLNTNYKEVIELLKNLDVIINNFKKEKGSLNLNIKNKKIKIIINKERHSSSTREDKDINFKNISNNDVLFDIFLKFISLSFKQELNKNMTFIDLYNFLNKNIHSLPFYNYEINNYNINIKLDNIVIKNLNLINYSFIINNQNLFLDSFLIKNSFPKGISRLDIYSVKKIQIENVSFPKNLKILSIQNCSLDSIPNSILILENLESLVLNNNEIKSLTDKNGRDISLPKNLEILDLNNNNLKSISSEVLFLKKLKIIFLSHNELKSLPDFDHEELSFSKELEKLNLNNNKLSSLPDNISFPESLQELNLNNNDFKSLPENIIFPKSLQILNLSYNKLESLSENIIFPESLQELFFKNNNLESLPENIKLPKNSYIDFSYNNLKSIPDGIKILNNIGLSNNKLRLLPNGISFSDEDSVTLHNNELELLPDDLYFSDDILYIFLSNNKLKELPNNIKFPKNLKELHLDNNEIESLPYGFSFPKKLEELHLNNNIIKSLPKDIIISKNTLVYF